MASTYEPIATTTLGSNQANIDFTSIPATYTDLKIIFNGALATQDALSLQFNSDTGNNYSYTRLQGNGSAAGSTRESNIPIAKVALIYSTSITSPDNAIIDVLNYANTTTYKTTISRGNSASAFVSSYVSLWRSTSAITSIRVRVDSGSNILTGSTATLYGIKAA
jgi:hypothetical protein